MTGGLCTSIIIEKNENNSSVYPLYTFVIIILIDIKLSRMTSLVKISNTGI